MKTASNDLALALDATRYRKLRDRLSPLEAHANDEGLSAYHVVGGVRELKWGDDLDAAVDAASGKAAAETPRTDGLREAFESARMEIVLAIAFLGRDAGTDRLAETINSLIGRLVAADAAALEALANPGAPAAPVGWQYRTDNGGWCPASPPDGDELADRGNAWRFRPVFATPDAALAHHQDLVRALEPFALIGLDILKSHPGWANPVFSSQWAGAYTLTYSQFEHAAAAVIADRQRIEEIKRDGASWDAVKTEFIVLCGQIVGNGPFNTEYSFDGERFAGRQEAVIHGFNSGRSDDFNIGCVESGKLVSLLWMDRTINTDPAEIEQIAKQVGLS